MKEIIITNENFESQVLKSEKPILVDFWASWCYPCKMLASELDKFMEDYSDKVLLGKINVDEQEELAIKFRVSSIPMLVLFNNGQIVKTIVGARSKQDLEYEFLPLIK